MKSTLRSMAIFCFSATIMLLVVIELILRFSGYPRGVFAPLVPSTGGLYPASLRIPMRWGPIQYTVNTNSLGFRGEEIAVQKTAGVFRIVTVGDSLTDGYFVDNDATWQYFLQGMLQKKSASKVEVINCAHGGGSIDWELYLLKRHGLPLTPDMVILTFSTNDIADILNVPLSQLYRAQDSVATPSISLSITRFLLTKTATGEAVVDGYLRVRSPTYRESRQRESLLSVNGADRYNIAGGMDFQANTEKFMLQMRDTDGILLNDSFSAETKEALKNYQVLLSAVKAACQKNNARLLFVFVPAYSQIYNANSPQLINATMRRMCGDLKIDFLDLTPGFRDAGYKEPLHLAPVDYHLNPYGNRVFAAIVERYIFNNSWIRQ